MRPKTDPSPANENDNNPIRVSFIFASYGIGGAEKSMLRLMQAAHPHILSCSVVLSGTANLDFVEALKPLSIPVWRVGHVNVIALAQHFRTQHTEVAYLFGQLRSLPWTLAARLAGVPVVIGAERAALDRRMDIIGRKLDRFVIDHYISNSQKAAHDLIERVGVQPQRVDVIYNGLPEQSGQPSPETLDINELGSPTIICVANVQQRKGQILLLRAIQLLRKDYPSIRAVLVGKDLTNGDLLRQFDAAGLKDCYTWTGFVPNVRDYLACSDVFVLPSLFYEGIPTSILEAMAERVPVIATDVGGVGELVIDGQTGLLAPPGDAAVLAECLRRVLASPELREQLVDRAQQHILQHHTIQSMVDKHVEVFLRVLNMKKRMS